MGGYWPRFQATEIIKIPIPMEEIEKFPILTCLIIPIPIYFFIPKSQFQIFPFLTLFTRANCSLPRARKQHARLRTTAQTNRTGDWKRAFIKHRARMVHCEKRDEMEDNSFKQLCNISNNSLRNTV